METMSPMETLAGVLRAAASRLADAGFDAPALEARRLLGHALGLDDTALLRARDDVLPPAMLAARFAPLLARRLAHEPLALILGRREFWSLEFAVSADTLIPRPDSETLISAALAARPDRAAMRRVLDLGTGTGCLLLAALQEYPAAFGIGVDIAPGAARLARDNAARLGLAGRAAFLCADWAAPLAAQFDLVLCNPPYIASAEMAGLMPEVARFEPLRALDGGADGLHAYRVLLPCIAGLLAPGGLGVLELGAGQALDVAEIAGAVGLQTARHADLAGVARALLAWRGTSPG